MICFGTKKTYENHYRNFICFFSIFISEKYPHESIMHFNDLMQMLDVHEKLNIFLLTGSTNNKIASIISRYFENNPERFKRIVICSRSPWIIYQVNIDHSNSSICAHLDIEQSEIRTYYNLSFLLDFILHSCENRIHIWCVLFGSIEFPIFDYHLFY